MLPEITKRGASLLVLSPMVAEGTKAMVEKHTLGMQVLSDPGNAVARKFGIVFALPESLRPIYKQFGIDVPKANGDDTFELPIPATYVIDRKGKITFSHVNLDHRTRAEPRDILAALDKLQP